MERAYSEMIYNVLRDRFKQAPEENLKEMARRIQRDPVPAFAKTALKSGERK